MRLVIRSFRSADLDQIVALFLDTVHDVNSSDYSKQQINAWAPRDKQGDIEWEHRITKDNGYVVLIGDQIVGFATIDDSGFIDFFYVHHEYQRRRIATYLYTRLEIEAEELGVYKITTHSSITAKPFFEKMGFIAITSNRVIKNGVGLDHWIMEKTL